MFNEVFMVKTELYLDKNQGKINFEKEIIKLKIF